MPWDGHLNNSRASSYQGKVATLDAGSTPVADADVTSTNKLTR